MSLSLRGLSALHVTQKFWSMAVHYKAELPGWEHSLHGQMRKPQSLASLPKVVLFTQVARERGKLHSDAYCPA